MSNLKKNNKPLIVVPIDDSISRINLRAIKKHQADIIETRIDLFKNIDLKSIITFILKIKELNLPVLATIRSVKEGGKNKFSENERLEIFKNIIPIIDYIDIELSSKKLFKILPYARSNGVKIILSYHNFKNTPSKKGLLKVASEAFNRKGNILKIAVMPRSESDVQNLLEFTIMNKSRRVIVIAMGELGKSSRVFFPLAGSIMTYSPVSGKTAPGQIDLKYMRKYIDEFYN